MKKALVKSTIIDDEKQKTITEVIGSFDEEKNILHYQDGNVEVCVIIGPKIIIERSNNDYKFCLILELNAVHKTKYEIYNPKMELELEVNTKSLNQSSNSLFSQYKLAINNEEVGNFTLEIEWEEQNEYKI